MKPVTMVALALGFADIFLLTSGYRVLVGETHNYNSSAANPTAQDSLTCSYFTGRKIVSSEYWYSENNIMGRDSCAFIKKELRG
jgi:hypothetical protein